ncbi:MAG: hypothetical protein LAT84_03420 [Balneolia bacterium]|nr:hypothetical protein [Balneolia bacterium]
MNTLYRSIILLLMLTLAAWTQPSDTILPASASTIAQAQDSDEPSLHVGGALRYNLILENFESDMDPTKGSFTMDMWRINVIYDNPGGIGLNFEYRFYPTFGTHFIKQGWLEYNFNPQTQVQLGVTQVPFGNLQYNSNNWWFSLPYYVGLEDDHDMGIKLTRTWDNFQLDAAYFFQPEPEGPVGGNGSFGTGGSGRYSYDVIPGDEASLTERNQFNLRGAYLFDSGEFGASVQYGQLYNSATDEFSGRYALAAHGSFDFGNFNVKPQFAYYSMDAQNDAGEDISTVFMGAYGIPYEVSTEAWIATLGLSYSYDVDWGPISNILFYNDFSYMENLIGEGTTTLASGDQLTLDNNFQETIQNITGFLVTAGPVFTYFDIAQGLNQPWLTDDFGVGVGPGHEDLGLRDPDYNIRFNINIGFYF